MSFRILLQLVFTVAGVSVFAGLNRHSTSETLDDAQWQNGELRLIVDSAHYTEPLIGGPGGSSSTMTGHELFLVTLFPDSTPARKPEIKKFLSLPGGYEHSFRWTTDRELLMHYFNASESGGKVTFFDPGIGKDVSAPSAVFQLLNRSRSAGVAILNGQSVLLDTRAKRQGTPEVLCHPPWTASLDRLKYGRLRAFLTQDAQYLVLLPAIESPSYVTASNFVVQVCSTNGAWRTWSIPLNRDWEKFVDAECVNGTILILSRRLADNGAEDEVKLTDMQGQIVSSNRVSAFTWEHIWNPQRRSILFPPVEVSYTRRTSNGDFYEWDYGSNTVRHMNLLR
jgi:hypothetical protein